MLAMLLLLHGDDIRMENIYFWSAILIVLLPVGTFAVMAVLLVRAYRRRERPPEVPRVGGRRS